MEVMPSSTALMIGIGYGVALTLILLSFVYIPPKLLRDKARIHKARLGSMIVFILGTVPIIPVISLLVRLSCYQSFLQGLLTHSLF